MLSKKLTKQLKELGLYNDFVKAAGGDNFAVQKLKIASEKSFSVRILLKSAAQQLKEIRLKMARGVKIEKPQQYEKLIAVSCNSSQKKSNVILRSKERERLIAEMKKLGVYELWRKSLRGDAEADKQLKALANSNAKVKRLMSHFRRTGFSGTGGVGRKSQRSRMQDHAAMTKGWVTIYRN